MPKHEFPIIDRLPNYPLSELVQLMKTERRKGADVINLGMGNPDGASPDFVVKKLCEAAQNPKNHRYSTSKGIENLRGAICNWYKRRYDVDLDPATEAVVTMGAKEGLSHLILAITDSSDVVLAPNPTYPIHYYSPILAKANVRDVRCDDLDFYLKKIY